MPAGCTRGLHLFTYTNAVDLGDTAWAFNNKKDGVYLFWDADENAPLAATASTFSAGHMALAGIGGLALGLLIAFIGGQMRKKRKGEVEEKAA